MFTDQAKDCGGEKEEKKKTHRESITQITRTDQQFNKNRNIQGV